MKLIEATPGSEAYRARIDEIQERLRGYLDKPHLVHAAEGLEKREQEIRELTAELSALISGVRIQASLDSEAVRESQNKLIAQWPYRLINQGREKVWIRTASGHQIQVEVTYFRRKGKRLRKKSGSKAAISACWCSASTSAVPPDSRPRSACWRPWSAPWRRRETS